MAYRMDLTGRRFGHLVVLRLDTEHYVSPSGKRGARRWVCRCDCGREVSVVQFSLLAKKYPTKSCGCANHETRSANAINLTGQRFGRLTVLGLDPEPYVSPSGKNRSRKWICQCDCGNVVSVQQASLRAKKNPSRSCGCLRGEASRDAAIDMTGMRFGRWTVEFLVTAAKLLQVPVDYLIKGSAAAVTPTEKYILSFLDKLIVDTQDGTLPWQGETTIVLSQVPVWNANHGLAAHPLYSATYDVDATPFSYYVSRFYKGEPVRPTATCYNVTLRDFSTQVYIMSCSMDRSDYSGEIIPSFYEVYLVKTSPQNEVIPLFCTTKACDAVNNRLDDLIGSINMMEAHVQVDSRARSIIDE